MNIIPIPLQRNINILSIYKTKAAPTIQRAAAVNNPHLTLATLPALVPSATGALAAALPDIPAPILLVMLAPDIILPDILATSEDMDRLSVIHIVLCTNFARGDWTFQIDADRLKLFTLSTVGGGQRILKVSLRAVPTISTSDVATPKLAAERPT